MGDRTAAERQRRYRAHKRGDHSLCPAGREDCATVTVTAPVTRNAVTSGSELGVRGRRLWQEYTAAGVELAPLERVLLEEACRIADRLDRLDALLSGSAEDWLSFVETKGMPDRQEIVIDKPLAEARQQATALKQLLAELRQSGAAGGKKDAAPPARPAADREPVTEGPAAVGGGGGSGVADLTARIAAARRAQAQGGDAS